MVWYPGRSLCAGPESGKGVCYRHDPNDPTSLGNDLVKAIYEDSAGDLWIGTWGGGLNRFDGEAGHFFRHTYDALNPYSLTNDKVAGIYEDDGGILWVATWGGGLSKYDRRQQRFVRFQHNPNDPTSLNNNIVYSIHEGADGRIWVGTEDALNGFDPAMTKFTHFLDDPNRPETIEAGEAVQAVFEDSEGVLWAGSWAEGLNRYDPGSGAFTHYRHDPDDPNSIQSDVILTIFEDSHGTLWFGTFFGGFNRFDREPEQFHAYRHDPQDPNSLSEDHVYVIHEDPSGLLWLGTGAGGLNWFDPESEQFGVLRHDPDDPTTLNADKINAIYQAEPGLLWVGTPNGLNKLAYEAADPSAATVVVHFNERDGLPSDVVQSILADDQGNLWLSTTRGIVRFNPDATSFRAYNVSNGLSGDDFNEGAAVRLRSGELLFGGGSGLTLFDPEAIKESAYVPPVKLTALKILNQPVLPGDDSLLQQSIWSTEQLFLSHEERVLTFEFAALGYANPAKNQLQYRMEGFDEAWSPPASTRSATYTNLDPGDYTFRVRGSNSDGLWDEEGTRLKITITPPWWQTLWFRSTFLLLLFLVAIVAYRWRVRNIRTRNQELEAEVASKTHDLQGEIVEHRETEVRLRRTRDELATVMALSQNMVSTLELDALLTLILDQLKRVVGYDGAGVLIRDGDSVQFRAYQGTPLDFDAQTLRFAYAGLPQLRHAIDEHQPFVVEDVHQEPGLAQQMEATIGEGLQAAFGDAHTWMGVPMVIGGEAIGLLGLLHHQPGFFADVDLALVQSSADQAAIALRNAQLYEQAQVAAAAEERNRLARDLHDSVTQTLFSASVMAETTPQVMRKNPDDGWRNLEKLRTMTKGALAEMRTLLLELRPEAITQLPLDQLLSTLADSTLGRSRIPVDLTVDEHCEPPEKVKVVLYRVAQEAINNVIKHADATEISVVLDCEEGRSTLSVSDNGCGFFLEQVASGHFGLAIMAERVASVGGALTIDSTVGNGTTVTVVSQKKEGNAHDR